MQNREGQTQESGEDLTAEATQEPAAQDQEADTSAQERERLLRQVAEATNVAERARARADRAAEEAPAKVCEQLFSTIDILDRALQHSNGTDDVARMALNELEQAMARCGVIPVNAAPGVPVDLTEHEKLYSIDQAEPCEIVKVERRGYKVESTGRVLRAASVGTAAIGTEAKRIAQMEQGSPDNSAGLA